MTIVQKNKFFFLNNELPHFGNKGSTGSSMEINYVKEYISKSKLSLFSLGKTCYNI